MYSLNARNETVYFDDICSGELPQVLKWYNLVEEFKYATGNDREITIDILLQKYREAMDSPVDFLAGIHLNRDGRMIGAMRGRIQYSEKNTGWLNFIVIDPEYQGRGYGSASVNLLINHLGTACGLKGIYLAVAEDNLRGMAFWAGNNFSGVRRMENRLSLSGRRCAAIIMYRRIS